MRRFRPDFRFSAFEVDFDGAELRKHGVRIQLQDQPFRILRLLLERAGEVVTRDELCRQLWPDGTFVDYDRGLNTAINRVREALNDPAGHPRFIETIPRRGYRFIGDLEAMRAPSQAAESPPPLTPVRRSRARIAAAVGVALAVVSTGAWLATRSDPPSTPAIKISQLTSYPGNEREPSLSPDGSRVAFSWDKGHGGRSHIFVRQIRSESMLRLSSAEADHHNPVWSPDGQWIAFLRSSRQSKADVVIVPALGGPERILVETSSPWFGGPSDVRPPLGHMTWSPDGKWLAVTETIGPSTGLSLVSVDSGRKTRLTSPAVEFLGDFSPEFSPDGGQLAFIRSNGGMSLSEIFVLALNAGFAAAGEPRQLTRQKCWIANPVWMRSDNAIAFSCGQWGAGRRLYRIQIPAGGEAELIGSAADDIYSLAYSSGTRRLIYTQEAMDWDIWRVDLDAARAHEDAGERFLSSTRIDCNPQYSPDGSRIAFDSMRSGTSQVWLANADGSDAWQLAAIPSVVTGFARWSPEGKRIAFHSRPELQAHVVVIDAAGGAPRTLTQTGDNTAPSWSQDGRWIYFSSKRHGTENVWKVPADGGSAVPVTSRGGAVALEVGRYVWYSKHFAGNVSLWKLPIEGGMESLVLDTIANFSTFAVLPEAVFFIGRDPSGRLAIQRRDQSTGGIIRIAQVGASVALGLTVSPDRRWLLYNRVNARESDLMLIENFE